MFFTKTRNKHLEAQQFLARLADQGTMDRVRKVQECRTELRTALSVGVWVIPMKEKVPDVENTFAALIKDVSSKGVSVITNQPLSASEVLVCILIQPEMKVLRAKVANCVERGLGWLQIGTEVIELVDKEQYPQLATLPKL